MNNNQYTHKEAIRIQELDLLAIFFFFLGGLDIYSSFQRKIRERQEKYEDRLRPNQGITLARYASLALLALIAAGILEISLL